MTVKSDDNVIFRANAAAAGRYVIIRFVLWVPKRMFHARGAQMFWQNNLKTTGLVLFEGTC